MIGIIMQIIVSGIAMGFIYALVGIEYTLIWNASGVLNFSHDKLITASAYVFAGTFIIKMGWGILPSVTCALIVMGVFGIIIAKSIFVPLKDQASMIFTIMGTVMLGKVIVEGVRLIWGPVPFTIKGFLSGTISLGGNIVIAVANIAIIVVASLVVILLQLFLNKTKTGRAMRSVAQNKAAAALMGIDVIRIMGITIAISSVICCIIGIMIIPLFNIDTTMSNMIGLKGFAAGVVGGFGYLPGAILGGLLIGIVENIGCIVFPSVFKDVVAFVLLVTFLLFRPQGLLGKKKAIRKKTGGLLR